ncbi:hypothetical protein ABIC94_001440 [Variovorax paradoxus]|uniref:AP2 domain-containing protein n=1 Tax=Variovorax paradoxus TaxID=34073 RepID=UPI00339865B0
MHAQAWRDEIVRAHPPTTRAARADKLRRNNTTGIPGVVCALGQDGRPSSWQARTYLGPGKVLRKCFSVGRYGADEAKALAIAERQKQLQQMHGLNRVHPAEAALRETPLQPLLADRPPPIDKGLLLRSTNKTGSSGVLFRKAYQTALGSWIARTYAGSGRYLQKSFAVRTYGEEAAKAMAIAERKQQLAQVARKRQLNTLLTAAVRSGIKDLAQHVEGNAP